MTDPKKPYREWFINPVVGYKCQINEDGIGLTGNEVHVIEKAALLEAQGELETLRSCEAQLQKANETIAALKAEIEKYKDL